ncbi:unnamed protein product, partial [Polarella glacialis]
DKFDSKGSGAKGDKGRGKGARPATSWSGGLAKDGAPRGERIGRSERGSGGWGNEPANEIGARKEEPDAMPMVGAKTVQQIEAEMLIAKLSSKGEMSTDKANKTPLEAKGSHCEVKKHSEIGCAVVTMESESAREVVMKLAIHKRADREQDNEGKERRPTISIGDVQVQLRSHVDKANKVEIKTDIFVAWGRQAEK